MEIKFLNGAIVNYENFVLAAFRMLIRAKIRSIKFLNWEVADSILRIIIKSPLFGHNSS